MHDTGLLCHHESQTEDALFSRLGDNPTFCCGFPGFISYIVEPLFEEWHRFTEPSLLSQTMMGHMHKNKARWSRLQYAPSDTQTHPHTKEPEPEGGGGGGEGDDIP